jgi:hypothetical protein
VRRTGRDRKDRRDKGRNNKVKENVRVAYVPQALAKSWTAVTAVAAGRLTITSKKRF